MPVKKMQICFIACPACPHLSINIRHRNTGNVSNELCRTCRKRIAESLSDRMKLVDDLITDSEFRIRLAE